MKAVPLCVLLMSALWLCCLSRHSQAANNDDSTNFSSYKTDSLVLAYKELSAVLNLKTCKPDCLQDRQKLLKALKSRWKEYFTFRTNISPTGNWTEEAQISHEEAGDLGNKLYAYGYRDGWTRMMIELISAFESSDNEEKTVDVERVFDKCYMEFSCNPTYVDSPYVDGYVAGKEGAEQLIKKALNEYAFYYLNTLPEKENESGKALFNDFDKSADDSDIVHISLNNTFMQKNRCEFLLKRNTDKSHSLSHLPHLECMWYMAEMFKKDRESRTKLNKQNEPGRPGRDPALNLPL